PDGNGHLARQQQSSDAREKPQDQHASAEKFDRAGKVDKISGKAHVLEHLYALARVREQFRIAVEDKDYSQRQTQQQQRQRLQPFETLHPNLSWQQGLHSRSKRPAL